MHPLEAGTEAGAACTLKSGLDLESQQYKNELSTCWKYRKGKTDIVNIC